MVTIDRRIRRTKKALEDALVELTLEKEYDKITIQEITDRADIGYRTFFRHFSDKDELLKNVLFEMMLELREIEIAPTAEMFADPIGAAFDLLDNAALFQHVQEHSDLYRVLMKSDRSFINSVMEFGMQEITADLAGLPELDIPRAILVNHTISSMFALIRWWLDTDMTISAEEMGSYATRLITNPFRDLLVESVSK